MPSTGNKFNDLYELSKIMKDQKKDVKEKTTEEHEFEKSHRECTFKPSINNYSGTKTGGEIIRRRSPVNTDVVRNLKGA